MGVLKGGVDGGRVREGDKSETPGVTGIPILGDHGANHSAILRKMVSQGVVGGLPGNPSKKELVPVGILHGGSGWGAREMGEMEEENEP